MKSKKGKTYEEMVARMKVGARAERERIEAEQNKSETLQIRLEPDLMRKILSIAEQKGIKHSTLVRSWIAQMANHELASRGTTGSVNESPTRELSSEELQRQMLYLLVDIQESVAMLSKDEPTKTKTPISQKKKK